MEKDDIKTHRLCAKGAKTVPAHAKCVAELLDKPVKKVVESAVKEMILKGREIGKKILSLKSGEE